MQRLFRSFQPQIHSLIIGPYLGLAILVVLLGFFIAFTLVADSWQERFDNQLGQTARNFTESFAQREITNIAYLGQITFTAPNEQNGAPAVPDAMAELDTSGLDLALQGLWRLGLNNEVQPDRLIVFDPQGIALTDFARSPDNPVEPIRYIGTDLSGIPLVRAVIGGRSEPIPGTEQLGDKYSGLVSFRNDQGQDTLYFFTVAPVYLQAEEGASERLVGGLLVAQRLDRLLNDLQNRSQAAISTIYDNSGAVRATTVAGVDLSELDLDEGLIAQLLTLNSSPTTTEGGPDQDPCLDIGLLSGQLAGPADSTPLPACSVNTTRQLGGSDYQIVYAPLLIRGVQSGFFSVGLSRDFITSSLSDSRNTVSAITVVLAVLTVVVGFWVAQRINRPVQDLVEAATAVTEGDLGQRSRVDRILELGTLASAFNQMTDHLLQLYTASRELNRTIEVEQVLRVTSEAAARFAPGVEALALLEHSDGFGYSYRPGAPASLTALDGRRLSAEGPMVAALATISDTDQLAALAGSDVLDDSGLGQAGMQTVFATPIRQQERLAGALIFAHHDRGAIDDAALPGLAVIANMAGAVLSNALLYTQVRRDARQRQAILSSIGDGVVVCDATGRISLLNQAAEQILQLYDWRERNLRFDDLPLEPIPQRKELFGRTDQHYSFGGRVITFSRAPVVGDETGAAGEVIVLHDVTEAVAVDKAKTDFIATISHELRTPLTVIRGFTELLLRGTGGEKLSEDQADLLGQVRGRAVDMTDMVNNAILIADIESGQLKTELLPQDVGTILTMALAPLRSAIEAKGLILQVEVPDDLPPVLADREQLKRALAQLIDNARRYTEQGTITLRAGTAGSQIVIEVTDTGPGIAADMLPRLFTRFQRIEGNNSAQRGAGLGLAITRQLIERQGGQVSVNSEVGQGSTFRIVLQQVNEQSLAVAQSNQSPASQ